MIDFSYKDQQVKLALDQNQDYINLVKNNATIGHIQIQVGNGHIILFHNINDTFVAYLLADELYYYRDNIDDIKFSCVSATGTNSPDLSISLFFGTISQSSTNGNVNCDVSNSGHNIFSP